MCHNHQDTSQVTGKQELDGVLDVGVYVSAVGYGFDDGRKVIVCQNHGRCVLRYFCTGDTHGNTDVSLFQWQARR